MALNKKLALLGGRPVRRKPFPKYPVLGKEVEKAVLQVIRSGNLSTFSASPSGILGGKNIQKFEKVFAEYHRVKHSIAVNSATAGLHCALAAIGCGPGDEVITTPYTFTSTATSILMHNSIPIFCDINNKTFCLNPDLLEKLITKKTKAILPVHLLGHPAEMNKIMKIARRYKLFVIEDCAQAPGARINGEVVGTIGHLGVFSFQETKNISIGEGGMIITNDDKVAERCRMLRNHGEVIVEGKKRGYLSNIIGWNYRMTEVEAAIGIEQFKKFDVFQSKRKKLFHYLIDNLSGIPGLSPPYIAPNVEHSYHVFGMRFNEKIVGISRNLFVEAVKAEGIPCGIGYPRPLYENPIFKERIAYGMNGCPFTCPYYGKQIAYTNGDCPVTEELCYHSAVWLYVVRPPATIKNMQDIVEAIKKVFSSINLLKKYGK